MKVIPELTDLELRNLSSSAEAKVYREFVKDNSEGTSDWVVVHSLGLANHDRKPYAEMDFLVITPFRYIGLEIKGGRVRCKDGRWLFTDRYGNENSKPESPLDQARGATFALRDFLKRKLSVRYFKFGFATMFPDIDASQSPFGTEWGEIPIYSKNDADKPISEFVRKVVQYWDGKKAGFDDIPPYYSTLIKELVLPDFDLKPTRYERYRELERTVNALTEQQYALLKFARKVPRFVVQGPAGSGKTFLALEDCALAVADGKRTLYVCSRDDFLCYVANEIIPTKFARLKNNPFFSSCSTESMVEGSVHFDLIVVDEAQDYMNQEMFLVLLDTLSGGVANGIFHIFYDDRQVVGYSQFDRFFLPWLKTQYAFVPLQLNQNCRNISSVVQGTVYLTGIDAGEPMVTSGDGDPVRTEEFQTDYELEAKVALEIEQLMMPEEGLNLSDIVVLVDNNRLQETLHSLKGRWPGIRIVKIDDYKGKESEFVICVIESLGSEFDAKRLYVGMTRAKKGLKIFMSNMALNAIRNHLQKLQDRRNRHV